MGYDRRKDSTRASVINKAPVPRYYEEDKQKLLAARDFIDRLLDDQGPMKEESLRRLSSMHIGFGSDTALVSLVVKIDRLVDGSATIGYVAGASKQENEDAVPSSTDSHD